MRVNVYRVMKAVYHMLDPSNEPSSTVDEVKDIATLEYAVSQENAGLPDISSLVIHLRLFTQTDTRFDVVLGDTRIEDKVENTRISLPVELIPVLIDISGFVLSFGCGCKWSLICCASCLIASCQSVSCRGSSEPPLALCAFHSENILCLPCLEEQGFKRKLENCPSCERWYCPIDLTSCIGHPVTTPLFPHAMNFCSQSPRIHPPKRGSCYGCKLPGWRHCASRSCWSRYDMVCPECTSGGITCVCQNVWACDVCTKHGSRIFIRCPSCDRSFCNSCDYIDRCAQWLRATLCFDCVEETSDTDDGVVEMFATLAGTCRNCGMTSWESCDRCTI
ncbi:hypothetical protein BD769DRAFT_1429046 [Suillus cothurnatus]|nr:hypothetical protein BD769DRAFT_1429046 [Suillus cothurnatus]